MDQLKYCRVTLCCTTFFRTEALSTVNSDFNEQLDSEQIVVSELFKISKNSFLAKISMYMAKQPGVNEH